MRVRMNANHRIGQITSGCGFAQYDILWHVCKFNRVDFVVFVNGKGIEGSADARVATSVLA